MKYTAERRFDDRGWACTARVSFEWQRIPEQHEDLELDKEVQDLVEWSLAMMLADAFVTPETRKKLNEARVLAIMEVLFKGLLKNEIPDLQYLNELDIQGRKRRW